MTTKNDNHFNICTIAVYGKPREMPSRVTALVSRTDNSLIDRLEWTDVDWEDDDAIDKIIDQLGDLMEKNHAEPLPLDNVVPNKQCPSCKKLTDIAVYIDDLDEREAHLQYCCWHCKKWLQSESDAESMLLESTFASSAAAAEASRGVSMVITGDISRTVAAGLVGLTAVKIEEAIVAKNGKGEGDITTPTGVKCGRWSVNVG